MIKHLHLFIACILLTAFAMNVSAQDVITFTFDEEDSYQQFGLEGWSEGKDIKLGDINESKTITAGDVTFTITPAEGNTATRMYKDYYGNYGLRSYNGTQFVISATRNIAKIEFAATKFQFTTDAGSLNGTTWTPEGDMVTATLDCYKSSTTTSVTITLVGGSVNPDDPTEVIAEDIAAFKTLCTKEGKDATLKLVDAQVLYVNEYVDKKGNNKQEVYIRDASGSLLFYNVGISVKAGDVLNGSVKGIAKDFYGTYECCANTDTDLTSLTITNGEAIATEITIPEVTNDEISNLVLMKCLKLESIDIADDKGNPITVYYLTDGMNHYLRYYNKFHIDGLNTEDVINEGTFDIEGIITLNYGELQVCPIKKNVDTGIENIELNVNTPIYNVAGQKVNSSYKGIVVQNDKKFNNK